MRSDDRNRLEVLVRGANPVPETDLLVDSAESAAVDALVRERRLATGSATGTGPAPLVPTNRRRRSAWAFVAALVLVIAGIGSATLLIGRDDAGIAEQPDGAPVDWAVQMGPVTWTKVETGDWSVTSVAPLGSGFIGTRTRIDASGAVVSAIATSPDGMIWSPVESNPLDDDELVAWSNGGPWGAIGVVGESGPTEVISTRDGVSWVRSDPASAAGLPGGERTIRGAAGSDGGLVVAYHLPELEPPDSEYIVSSADGVTWTVVERPDGVIFMRGLVGTPFGFLLTAEADLPERSNPGILTWLSVDGVTWEEVIVTDAFIADAGLASAWRDGVVTFGVTYDPSTDTGTSQVYQSGDARVWTEMDMTPFESFSPLAFHGTDHGLLAVAVGDGGALHMMFTTDARTWTTMPVGDVFGSPDVAWAQIASGSDRLLVTVNAPGAGTIDQSTSVDLWVGVIEAPESAPVPSTLRVTPTTGAPDTTAAAKGPLADFDLSTVTENLWLLMPTRRNAADIVGLSDHSVLWWDTDSPWFVSAGEWWSAEAWGAGHITMMTDGKPDTALQFGVYETAADASYAIDAAALQARFTDPSRLIDGIALPVGIEGFALALDRAADEGFVPEPEALADPNYVSHLEPFDQIWIAVLQLDRVVAAIAMHGDGDAGTEPLVELAQAVAERADRFGSLVADPPHPPSPSPQPLPHLIFAGSGPTWASLGIPSAFQSGGWAIEPCEWMGDRCLEISRDGRPLRWMELTTMIPWGGFDPGLSPAEALEDWALRTASVWGDDTVSDVRHFEINGAPAVRVHNTYASEGEEPAAAIDVYFLAGNPLASFGIFSWDEIGDGVDPGLISDMVPFVDQLLVEADTGA